MLAVFDARDVRLVDVDFDFIRMHVHNRGYARARKAATRGIGRNHLADVGVLGDDNAGERCANGAIVHRLLGDADTGFGGSYLLLGELDFGLEAVRGGRGVVESFLSLDACLLQLLGAMQQNLRVLELDLIVSDTCSGGIAVGSCPIYNPFYLQIIEGGEELARGHAGAFVKKDAGHPSGNLGGDGGAAAGRDVAAGVQQRLARSGFRLGGGHNLDSRPLTAQSKSGGVSAGEDEDPYGRLDQTLRSSS